MGGLALKKANVRRYTRQEFETVSKELINILSKEIGRCRVPLFYKTKESFGDIDILIELSDDLFDSNYMEKMKNFIQITFNPSMIVINDNCASFDYKEVQVDFIFSSTSNYESHYNYLCYNDLGNMIGRIAQTLGLKYGINGLTYKHSFKNQFIGEILITKDYKKILEFLDLSCAKFDEGFDTLEDIFSFVSESKFFSGKSYQFDQLNKINRDRNKKRSSYLKLLEWIDNNISSEKYFYTPQESSVYLDEAKKTFPEANIDINIKRLEFLTTRDLYVKAKFSGRVLIEKYNYDKSQVSAVMNTFKHYINKHYGSYNDFILYTEIDEIHKTFEDFMNES